ncbi:MAG TPA: hypothetical protein VFO07_06695 [Roseiflexaceae bacterium]|nr:hypothetical protein [Roseiflexaceae bacterium]
MFRTLSTLLAKSVGALRGIADLHPAVFSVSDWSAPQSPRGVAYRQHTVDVHAIEPEIPHSNAGPANQRPAARPGPTIEPRLAERTQAN